MIWKDWLYFNRSQRRGIRVLLALIWLIITIPAVYYWLVPVPAYDFSEFEVYLHDFMLRQDSLSQPAQTHTHEPAKENTSPSAYTGQPARNAASPSSGPKPVLHINLNLTDTLELRQIYGIGPAFARRIVAYRELLGGYVHTRQLLEVYGMDSARWEGMLPFVYTDSSLIRQININETTFGQLIRHPYIDRDLANAILNYSRQHAPFDSVAQLLGSHLIDQARLAPLQPYLTAETKSEF